MRAQSFTRARDHLTKSDVEEAALEWLAALGWRKAHGPDIGPGAAGEERADYGAVVLERRLRDALARPGGVPATV